MGEIHGELVHWAMEGGVELNGIEPRTIPGKGTGIFATRKLKVIDLSVAFEFV